MVLTIGEPLTVTGPGSTGRRLPSTPSPAGSTPARPPSTTTATSSACSSTSNPSAPGSCWACPPRRSTGAVVSLDDVLGPAARELVDRLRPWPPDWRRRPWAARFAIVDAALHRRRPPGPRRRATVPDEVRWACRRIRATGGATSSVADLADEVGWSRRHLERAVPRRGRPAAEGLRPGAALRAGPPAAAGARPPRARHRRRRGRLLRPGPPDPGVRRAGRVPADRGGWPTSTSHPSKTSNRSEAQMSGMETTSTTETTSPRRPARDRGTHPQDRVAVRELRRRPRRHPLPDHRLRLRGAHRRRRRRRRPPRRAALARGRRHHARLVEPGGQRVRPPGHRVRVDLRRHRRARRALRPGHRGRRRGRAGPGGRRLRLRGASPCATPRATSGASAPTAAPDHPSALGSVEPGGVHDAEEEARRGAAGAPCAGPRARRRAGGSSV